VNFTYGVQLRLNTPECRGFVAAEKLECSRFIIGAAAAIAGAFRKVSRSMWLARQD